MAPNWKIIEKEAWILAGLDRESFVEIVSFYNQSPLLFAMAHMQDYHSINGNDGHHGLKTDDFGEEVAESRQRNTGYVFLDRVWSEGV
jgi:hypothetical protein